MKYVVFETNGLKSLLEALYGSFKWEHIGTTAPAINLSDVAIARQNQTTGKTCYIEPIMNESQANDFTLKAQQYGITVEIVDEATAIAKRDELLNQTTGA